MKRLLPLLLLSFAAQAQNPKFDAKKFKEDASYRDALLNYLSQKNQRENASIGGATVGSPVLINPKPGVHRLPQDNMPCIVPDTKNIAAMPNAWKGAVKVPYRSNPPQIPNPALPIIIQTDKLKNNPDTK